MGNCEQVLNHRICVANRLNIMHDGDKVSSLSIMSDEARQEVYDYFNTPEAYVSGDGHLLADPYLDSVERVLKNITGLYKS